MSKQIKVIKQTPLLESESRIGKKKFWRKESEKGDTGKESSLRVQFLPDDDARGDDERR